MLNKFWLPLAQKMPEYYKVPQCDSCSSWLSQISHVCKQKMWAEHQLCLLKMGSNWLPLFARTVLFFFFNCFCKQGITGKKIFCRNIILENPSHNCRYSQWSSLLRLWFAYSVVDTFTPKEHCRRHPVTCFYPWHSTPHPEMRARDQAAGRVGSPWDQRGTPLI